MRRESSFIERVLIPRIQYLIWAYLVDGPELMEDVPDSVQGPARTRLEELANEIANLKAATVPHLVEAQVDYVRTAPDLSSPPDSHSNSAGGVMGWGATADSPWPVGTSVTVRYKIPHGEYPKLDALKREERNKKREFKRLLEEVRANLDAPEKRAGVQDFKRLVEQVTGRRGIR